MVKYSITSNLFEGEMTLEYSLNGYLIAFSNTAILSEEMVKWLSRNFPTTEELLKEMLSKARTLKSSKIERIPTFEEFWEEYDYKVDKEPALKQWNQLSDVNKCMALETIKPYRNFLILNPSTQKIYPVRYLKNKRFEVDYRKLMK